MTVTLLRFFQAVILFLAVFGGAKADASPLALTWQHTKDVVYAEIHRRVGNSGVFDKVAATSIKPGVMVASVDYYASADNEFVVRGYDRLGGLVDASWVRVLKDDRKERVQFPNAVILDVASHGAMWEKGKAKLPFDADSRGARVYVLKNGDYWLEDGDYLELPSKSALFMDKGAAIRLRPQSSGSYQAVLLQGVVDVRIFGGRIEGDRDTHLGAGGEWGMCLKLIDVENVYIESVALKACWGDGLYLGVKKYQSRMVWIEGVLADGNRRNGITVVAGENVVVSNSVSVRNSGAAPEAGLDIEPNRAGDVLRGVRVLNLQTRENGGPGLQVGLGKLNEGSSAFQIELDGHRDVGSATGVLLSNGSAKGLIDVKGGVWEGQKKRRVVIRDRSVTSRWIRYSTPELEPVREFVKYK